MSEYECVDSVETLTKTLERVKNAQKEFSKYSQEQVDKIFQAAAIAANEARIPLAKMAVEETGMGIVEDKVIKNHYAAEYIYNKYKNEKTCGVIYQDDSYGIKKIAEPVGIVAAVIPTTNPTSTAIFKTLIALKTRNGIIISPHPRAKKSTIEAAKTVLEAAVKAGAPEGIIAWIDVPSLELTNMLMQSVDIILATGGPGMVKSAYSSGKPALGVGAGNTPAVIDESANVILAVNSIIHSKTFDNGMICASEQSVIVSDKIYDKVKDEFVKRGCYILNPEETEKVRKTIIINGALNAKIVGQKAHTIAELAGVSVPENTKILIGEVESVDLSEEFAHEKLSPVLAMYKSSSFDDALEKAYRLIEDGGLGHTSSLYVNTVTEKEKIEKIVATMEELCKQIEELREKNSKILNEKINEELVQLEMKNARFNAKVIEDGEFSINGKSHVEFVITTNLGEEEKKLNKIASGGEMSRIMLAIKTVLSDIDEVPVLIFDEIDTGISGKAANSVGSKLKKIAKKHQVIIVTHLATIAAQGDYNYYIYKEVAANKTNTNVKLLNESETIREIARIASGEITEISLSHARELRNKNV